LSPTTKGTIEPKHRLAYQPTGLGVNLTPSSFSPSIDRVDNRSNTQGDIVNYFIDLPAVTEVKLKFDYDPGDIRKELIITGERETPDDYKIQGQLIQSERKLGPFERKLAINSNLILLNHFNRTNDNQTQLAPVRDGVLHLQFEYAKHFIDSIHHQLSPKYQPSKTSIDQPVIVQRNQPPISPTIQLDQPVIVQKNQPPITPTIQPNQPVIIQRNQPITPTIQQNQPTSTQEDDYEFKIEPPKKKSNH